MIKLFLHTEGLCNSWSKIFRLSNTVIQNAFYLNFNAVQFKASILLFKII